MHFDAARAVAVAKRGFGFRDVFRANTYDENAFLYVQLFTRVAHEGLPRALLAVALRGVGTQASSFNICHRACERRRSKAGEAPYLLPSQPDSI